MTGVSEQPVSLPAKDPANPYTDSLPPQPATISAEQLRTALGAFLRVCIRTPDTTLVVVMSREDAIAWGTFLRQQGEGLTGLIVPGTIL